MLIKAPLKKENAELKMYREMGEGLQDPELGIYTGTLNFHLFLDDLPRETLSFAEYDWPEKYVKDILGHTNAEYYFTCDGYLSPFGVCDSIEQWKEHCKALIDHPTLKVFASFCEIRKDEQPKKGGWRWHKWGPYIGVHEPQCEYLYDEPEIESVFVYHTYVMPW